MINTGTTADSLSEQFGFEEGRCTLSAGFPSKTFTKRAAEILASAAKDLCSTPEGISGQCLQYGSSQGGATFRNELAKFLTEQYNDKEPISSDNLQVSAGATHGLHFAASEFLQAGDVVFVEDPTYFIAIQILTKDLGMKIIPVQTDGDGMVVEDLEELVEKHVDRSKKTNEWRPFRAMVYCIPTFNNPTSQSLTPARSRRLVEVAKKHDLLVFCDDVYNLLKYTDDESASKRLLAYEIEKYGKETGNIISNGTFSKIMGPGVRVGWIEAGKNVITRLQESNIAWSGGSFNHYGSQLMTIAMKNGHQQQMIKDMIDEHKKRIKAVNKVLDDQLHKEVKYQSPKGGYFYWLELPKRIDMEKLIKISDGLMVNFIEGHRCSPSGKFKNCIRLSFSYFEEEKLVRGTQLLCKAIHKALE